MGFRNQLKQNQLAIISLLVAFTALGYNTWRNELSEQNRNYREAGFEMLMHVSELQKITFLAHYDNDTVNGNPRKGWTEVLILDDLAMLMPANTPLHVAELHSAWEKNWQKLGKDQTGADAMDLSIDILRSDILAALQTLD
jgi:hypothetical protein